MIFDAPSYELAVLQMWSLSKTLTFHINGFDSYTLTTIKRVHWSNLVSNKELCQMISQWKIFYTIAVFTDSVMSCNNLMTPLPESFTSSTNHLQAGDDLTEDHAATVKILFTRASNRLICCWRMF